MAIINIPVNPYSLNNKVYSKPIPEGVTISFFINSETPISDVAFIDLRLSVFDGLGNEVLPDVAPLQDLVFSGGYRVYCDNLIINGLSKGQTYSLLIYDVNDDSTVLDLGCFTFVDPSSRYTEVSYRNSSDIFNFSYEALPNFRNVLYLDLAEIDNQNEYDFTDYSEASTGIIRNQKSQTKNFSVFQSSLFDNDAHEGMKGLSMHDDILINSRSYSVKEGYQVETDIRSKTANGTIEMYDIARNEINLNI